jgi:hypothetical protein
VDFDEVFSPVVKMRSLRFLLGVVTHEDLKLLQVDVKMAFLHGDLDEEVYMDSRKALRHQAMNISYVGYGRACKD